MTEDVKAVITKGGTFISIGALIAAVLIVWKTGTETGEIRTTIGGLTKSVDSLHESMKENSSAMTTLAKELAVSNSTQKVMELRIDSLAERLTRIESQIISEKPK